MSEEEGGSDQLFGELVSFLSHPRKDVQEAALLQILGLSEDEQFQVFCEANKGEFLTKLLRKIGGDFSSTALKILINFSGKERIANTLLKSTKVISIVFEDLEQHTKLSNLSERYDELHLMLISNLTRFEDGKLQVLQASEAFPEEWPYGRHIARLLGLFLQEKRDLDENRNEEKDPHCWIASILCNLTTTKKGRKALTKEEDYKLINLLCRQLRYSSRRKPLLTCLRHLCNEQTAHTFLLSKRCSLVNVLFAVIDASSKAVLNYRAKKTLDVLDEDENCSLKSKPKDEEEVQDLAVGEDSEYFKILTESMENYSSQKHLKDEGNDAASTQERDSTSKCEETELDSVYIHWFAMLEGKNSIQDEEYKEECRSIASDCILALCASMEGRRCLRRLGLFEKLLIWYPMKSNKGILDTMKQIIHLSRFPEEIEVNRLIKLE